MAKDFEPFDKAVSSMLTGRSGTVYDTGAYEGLERMHRQRDFLLAHFGSLKAALYGIAGILDTIEDSEPPQEAIINLLTAARQLRG